jgi:hypothetical protein
MGWPPARQPKSHEAFATFVDIVARDENYLSVMLTIH